MTDLFGNEKIRTLGMKQPFATLLLCGKDLETRWVMDGRNPPFPRGLYMFYSTGKGYKKGNTMSITGSQFNRAWTTYMKHPTAGLFGQPLCIGEIVDHSVMKKADEERAFVAYPYLQPGRTLWCLTIVDCKQIKPFPFKGKQGVGFLSDSDRAKIEFV